MVLVQSFANRTLVPNPDPTISKTHIYLPRVWGRIFGKDNEERAGKCLMGTTITKAPLASVESSVYKLEDNTHFFSSQTQPPSLKYFSISVMLPHRTG